MSYLDKIRDEFIEMVYDSLEEKDRGPGTPFDDWKKMFNRVASHKQAVPELAYQQCEELFAKLPPRKNSARLPEIEFTE
jgi:hypothetical protein